MLFLWMVFFQAMAQAEPDASAHERIAVLENNVRHVQGGLDRIDGRLDGIEEKLSGLAKNDSPYHGLLELLVLLIVGGDKAGYWIRKRNGRNGKDR